MESNEFDSPDGGVGMQDNTTLKDNTEMNREGSYGGFQYRHDYDEYKKELALKQQRKRNRVIIISLIVAAFLILLGFVTVFVADTIMRTKGYTFYDYLHGNKPASLVPHKTDLDAEAASALFSESTVTVRCGGAASCGVILTEDGYILTASSAVPDRQALSVTAADGREIVAKFIGEDAENGICLIKVDKTDMKAAEIGDSRALTEGQHVYSVSPAAGVTTCSVISSSDLSKISVSGGDLIVGTALINTYGQLVGIVTGTDGDTVTASHMAAVLGPIKKLITSPSNGGIRVSVTPVSVAALGIRVEAVTEKQAKTYGIPIGCFIVSADDGSAFRRDDIIVSVNGVAVTDAASLESAISSGTDTVRIYRSGSYTEITVK